MCLDFTCAKLRPMQTTLPACLSEAAVGVDIVAIDLLRPNILGPIRVAIVEINDERAHSFGC